VEEKISSRALALGICIVAFAASLSLSFLNPGSSPTGDVVYEYFYNDTPETETPGTTGAPETNGTGGGIQIGGETGEPGIQAIPGDCPSGMISYWQGEGNAQDSFDTKPGTLSGGVTFTSGRVGQAFSFDGVNGYVQVTNSGNFLTSPGTMAMWFKTSAPTGILYGIQNAGVGGSPSGWVPSLYIANGYLHGVYGWTGGVSNQVVMYSNVADGNWHLTVLESDGSKILMYVDGSLIGTLGFSSIDINFAGYQQIGVGYGQSWPDLSGSPSNWYYFNGQIDEVALFSRALNAGEIQTMYNSGRYSGKGYCEAVSAVCGNGVPEGTEACDDGAGNTACGPCKPDCTIKAAVCGDGCIDKTTDFYTNETCDDGNAVGNDGCRGDCRDIEEGYRCDKFAPRDVGSGPSNCTRLCGNCIVDNSSTCQGSHIDGCRLGSQEKCDDGNNVGSDGCRGDCTDVEAAPLWFCNEYYGNGTSCGMTGSVCCEAGPDCEDCDDGLDNDANGLVDCVDPYCEHLFGDCAVCGNGIVEPGEECDSNDTCCNNTACKFKLSGAICRASGGVCDLAETCNGTSESCPTDAFNSTSDVCRASAGICDAEEKCTGSLADCSADSKSTDECRSSAGACDLAESCDGVTDDCPVDVKSTLECHASAGICDVAESCDGVNDDCPADSKSTDECRASGGVCDAAENCDGVNDDCPADSKSTAVCRTSAGACDLADSCDGVTNDCPADSKSTAECRAVAGVCDTAESCDGTSDDCPTDSKSTAECRASGGVCDPAEGCDGINNDCPADSKSTAECRASAGVCDPAENCNGIGDGCPADLKSTAECRPLTGPCDVSEDCDGINDDCPLDAFQPMTTICRTWQGPCDMTDFCTGASAPCPPDQKSIAICRPAAGDCDVVESCNGSSNDCPIDVNPACPDEGGGNDAATGYILTTPSSTELPPPEEPAEEPTEEPAEKPVVPAEQPPSNLKPLEEIEGTLPVSGPAPTPPFLLFVLLGGGVAIVLVLFLFNRGKL